MKTAKTIGTMVVAIAIITAVCLAQSPRENDSRWNDAGSDVTSLTVTNGMTIALINDKMVLTTTSVAGGTNALTITTPFLRKGIVVLKAAAANANHITIATGAVIRASGNIKLVPGAAVATSDTVVLYITETNKAYVVGGIVY